MKGWFTILAAIALAWGLADAGCAQGFPGDMGGIGGFGGYTPNHLRTAACAGTGLRFKNEFSVYYGWLEQRDGSTWALHRQNSTGTATWPLRGSWIQATEELTFDGSFGLLMSAGLFFPRHTGGTWFSTPGTRSFDFEIPSYDWWLVDGMIKANVSSGLDFLAGFRWDRTSTRVDFTDNTRDDYILNAYLPLVGVQMKQLFSHGVFLIRLVAAPLVRGKMTYHSWDQLGYSESGDFPINSQSSFVEVLADCKFKMRRDILIGAFAKYNMMRARTETRSLSGSTDDAVAWAVNIKSWVIGGAISLDF